MVDFCGWVFFPSVAGEETFPCFRFDEGFWWLPWPAIGHGGRALGSPGLVLQQYRTSAGGYGHFVPGTERGWLLELAHG